jgi:hypothetical protein
MARLLALVVMLFLAAPAGARPPPEDTVPQRLDGPGPRAFAKFKVADQRCGVLRDGSDDTRIYNTFEQAILRLTFGNDTRRILPLLMTDKTGDGNILKVKLRTACVLSMKRRGAIYELRVTTRLEPPGAEATLRVDAEGRLLNPEDNGGLFHVVGENSRENRLIDRFSLISKRLERFTCLPGEADTSCEYQFLNYAERLFADEVRHQSVLPHPARKDHHAEVSAAVAKAVDDPLMLALHRLIVANESSTISPFQIWDAVLADSGLSFGPHQWDIGINDDGRRIFGKLAKLAGLNSPDRYFRSLWRFSTAEFQDYLLWRGAMNQAMQSEPGRALIIEEYIKWLKSDALDRASTALPFLDPLRPDHRLLMLYYTDVDNQYGDEALKRDLQRLMKDLAEQGATRDVIRDTLHRRMMKTPFAVTYPDKAAARLARTWEIVSTL